MRMLLEYDDYHWKSPENCLSTIHRFVERYPSIKITLFTVPFHSHLPLQSNVQWCKDTRKLIQSNNIRLAPHGLLHSQQEFLHTNYKKTIDKLGQIKLYFNRAGLDYIKVFRGPHWGINPEAYSALKDSGYTHIYSHEDYNHIRLDGIQTVVYNWNLKDEPRDLPLLIGHGHTHNVCGNGIEETFDRVCSSIDKYNPQFIFADEV